MICKNTKHLSKWVIFSVLLIPLQIISANVDEKVEKGIYAGEFPLTAQFRSGPRNQVSTYEKWSSLQFKMDDKYTVDLQSSVLRFAPENYEFVNRYAKEHPNTLILSTWRAASGNPKGKEAIGNGDPLGQSVIEFPGHFVLHPGTFLHSNTRKSFSSTDTSFAVEDVSKVIVGPALLVEVEVEPNNDSFLVDQTSFRWENFEYVLIEGVRNSLVTVKRAFNGSPPARNFPTSSKSGKRLIRTYVANLPWDFRVNTDYTDWFFNFSPNCPLDSNGKSATDVILEHMVYPLKRSTPYDGSDDNNENGPLHSIGGLDLASGPLAFAPSNADYNVDGIMNGNDDESIYWKGVKNFYERIWDILGENRALLTDFNFQMTKYINGPNLEGLARPNDPWKEVSRTVNNVLAWKVLSEKPFISLAFVQYMTNNEDKEKRIDFHRLLNGYAACLGVASDVDNHHYDADDGLAEVKILERDELFMGSKRKPHWLGKNVGSMVRTATLAPNLLLNYDGTSANDWKNMLDSLDILRADLIIDGEDLVIKPNGKGTGFVTFYLNFEISKKTDVTVFMEAISDDDTLVRNIKLPRISVNVDTKPVRATLTNKDYLPISWLVRGATPTNNKTTKVQFDIRFGPGGNIRIRKLSVHARTDALACQFEKGVVLVNPSLQDLELDLTKVFPNSSHKYQRLIASQVQGKNIPDKYQNQYKQTLLQNDGSIVKKPNKIVVRERNALFLSTFDSVDDDPSEISVPNSVPESAPLPSPIQKPIPMINPDSYQDVELPLNTKPPTQAPRRKKKRKNKRKKKNNDRALVLVST